MSQRRRSQERRHRRSEPVRLARRPDRVGDSLAPRQASVDEVSFIGRVACDERLDGSIPAGQEDSRLRRVETDQHGVRSLDGGRGGRCARGCPLRDEKRAVSRSTPLTASNTAAASNAAERLVTSELGAGTVARTVSLKIWFHSTTGSVVDIAPAGCGAGIAAAPVAVASPDMAPDTQQARAAAAIN